MRKSETPSFALLLDWMEGHLSAEEAQAVSEQLDQADESIQATVSWLGRFQTTRQTVTLATPPASVREGLNRRFAAFAKERQQPNLLTRLVALLTFDSRAQMASVGVRSAATQGLERQLLYSTEAAEIALNLQPDAQGQQVTLTGQVFATEEQEMITIQLVRADHEVAIASADELGEFAFRPLPVGDYDLIVSGEQFEVVLPAIPLHP
ncbi:MAG: hypothetical protein H0T73_01425 [Ardenticatenales bacterium]|nr:hypothetical protein [Ardenticatenales bacterium]